jgi:plastocyanin
MNKKVVIGAVIAILIILGIVLFMVLKSSPQEEEPPTQETPQNNTPATPDPDPVPENSTEQNSSEDTPEEPQGPQTHTVEMLDFEFSPGTITIKNGDTVTWINKGKGPHYVMTASGKRILDSKIVPSGESWSYTFNITGTHYYFSPVYEAMSGKVIVEED